MQPLKSESPTLQAYNLNLLTSLEMVGATVKSLSCKHTVDKFFVPMRFFTA